MPEEFGQDYIKEHYCHEICLLHRELTSVKDLDRINPKHLGMDTNFLGSELQRNEAEQLADYFD